MAGCKDCEKCTKSFMGKLATGALALSTGGLSMLSAAVAAPFKRSCPQCGHSMSNHEAVKVQIANLVAQQAPQQAPQIVVVQVAAPAYQGPAAPARCRCDHCGATFTESAKCPECGAAAVLIPAQAAPPVAPPAVSVQIPQPTFAPVPPIPAPSSRGTGVVGFAKQHPKGVLLGIGALLVIGQVNKKAKSDKPVVTTDIAAATAAKPVAPPIAIVDTKIEPIPISQPKPVDARIIDPAVAAEEARLAAEKKQVDDKAAAEASKKQLEDDKKSLAAEKQAEADRLKARVFLKTPQPDQFTVNLWQALSSTGDPDMLWETKYKGKFIRWNAKYEREAFIVKFVASAGESTSISCKDFDIAHDGAAFSPKRWQQIAVEGRLDSFKKQLGKEKIEYVLTDCIVKLK
jgi:hypothetical protein